VSGMSTEEMLAQLDAAEKRCEELLREKTAARDRVIALAAEWERKADLGRVDAKSRALSLDAAARMMIAAALRSCAEELRALLAPQPAATAPAAAVEPPRCPTCGKIECVGAASPGLCRLEPAAPAAASTDPSEKKP
jgi:cell division septum initiation protein DivIVA